MGAILLRLATGATWCPNIGPQVKISKKRQQRLERRGNLASTKQGRTGRQRIQARKAHKGSKGNTWPRGTKEARWAKHSKFTSSKPNLCTKSSQKLCKRKQTPTRKQGEREMSTMSNHTKRPKSQPTQKQGKLTQRATRVPRPGVVRTISSQEADGNAQATYKQAKKHDGARGGGPNKGRAIQTQD